MLSLDITLWQVICLWQLHYEASSAAGSLSSSVSCFTCKETLEDFSVTCLKHLSSNGFLSSRFPIFVFNNGISSQRYRLIT